MVTLKNGGSAEEAVITRIMNSLVTMRISTWSIITLSDLVCICRDDSHVIPDSYSRNELVRLQLVVSFDARGIATVHDSVRDVVLSAVKGDGIDMTVMSPIAT